MRIFQSAVADRELVAEFLKLTTQLAASDAARYCGVDPNTIMNWRRGRSHLLRDVTRVRLSAFVSAHHQNLGTADRNSFRMKDGNV